MSWRAFTLVALCVRASAALAQTDPDLDRIPAAVSEQTSVTSPANRNLYLQGDLMLNSLRDDLVVPLPPPPPPQWEGRVFLDMRLSWRLHDDLSFAYSGRFNLRAEDGLAFPSSENVRNDWREAYLAWSADKGVFLELGRVNIKSGVALGFNPTDYFKTRAVVEPTSADPTVLREDRLGTVMLKAEAVWPSGSLTLAYAPKLSDDSPPYVNSNLPSFNPMLDRTNAYARGLIKGSIDLPNGISPEFLLYEEAGQRQFGINLSKGLGRAIVGYLEWSGGKRASLAAEAVEDAQRNNVFPDGSPIPVSGNRFFANSLAIGASYASQSGVDFNLEFDYHQAGFSDADWHNWFGAANAVNPPVSELWFIRGYAADQQEPMARGSLFLRADWRDALVRNLNLTSFVDTDLYDGSGLAQLAADYNLSPQWTVGALVDVSFGQRRSNFGSLPQGVAALAKIMRYF